MKRRPSIGQRVGYAVDAAAHAVRAMIMTLPYIGAYNSTNPQRENLDGWRPLQATPDQAIAWNLTTIIAQSRQLERTNGQARGMVDGFEGEIVGTGIFPEPDTGIDAIDKALSEDLEPWLANCTPEGLSFLELQRQAAREWCTGGAHLWREITLPERLKDDLVPMVLLPLEVEWLTFYPIQAIAAQNSYVRGVELDHLGRPVNYHLMDYDMLNQMGLGAAWGGPGYVVPAREIIHGFLKKRPRQTHGEPILTIGIERTKCDESLVDVELTAARVTAAPAMAIKAKYFQGCNTDSVGRPVTDIKAGATVRLDLEEEIQLLANPRPSEKLAPFRRDLRGDLAAGWGSSRQYLERDPSQANYSSMTNDRNTSDVLRAPVQAIFARTACSDPYQRFANWSLLRRGIPIPANAAKRRALYHHKILFPARPYVDAEKDSKAAAYQIDQGLSTRQAECAKQGKDYAQIRRQRLREQMEVDSDQLERVAAIQKIIAGNPLLADVSWPEVLGAAQTAATSALLTADAQRASAGQPADETEASDAA